MQRTTNYASTLPVIASAFGLAAKTFRFALVFGATSVLIRSSRIDTDENVFQFYSYSPVRVPAGAFVAITETVNRINCRLRVGRFELDCDDGELRYQVGQILPNGSLDDDTIEGVIATTIAMLNIYLPAFICVIYGNELPEEAVKHAWPRGDGSDESQRRDG